jgi:hypothetical protein
LQRALDWGLRMGHIAKVLGAAVGLLSSTIYSQSNDSPHVTNGWKYYSDNELSNPKIDVHDYFLQESVKRTWTDSGETQTVTVWTKSLSAIAVDNVGKLSKDAVDRDAKKLLLGYEPPFSDIKKLNEDERLGLIIWEEVADDQLVQPEMKMLVQLDCVHGLVRNLSVVVTHGGKFGSSDTAGQWERIVPESSSANLSKILCVRLNSGQSRK